MTPSSNTAVPTITTSSGRNTANATHPIVPATQIQRGQRRSLAGNVNAAQKAFGHRAHMNSLAAQGKWRAELEKQAA